MSRSPVMAVPHRLQPIDSQASRTLMMSAPLPTGEGDSPLTTGESSPTKPHAPLPDGEVNLASKRALDHVSSASQSAPPPQPVHISNKRAKHTQEPPAESHASTTVPKLLSFHVDASSSFDSDKVRFESSDDDASDAADSLCQEHLQKSSEHHRTISEPPAAVLSGRSPSVPVLDSYPAGFLSTLQIFRDSKLERAHSSVPEVGTSLHHLCGDRSTTPHSLATALPHELGLREHQRQMEIRENSLSALATAQQCSTGSYVVFENSKHNNLLLAVLPRY